MHISHRFIQKYLGQHIRCHTHWGTFHGIVVHCNRRHLILAISSPAAGASKFGMMPRHYPMGPGGPIGPGGPGFGGGWSLAIPLAAILGVTAIGMHWW